MDSNNSSSLLDKTAEQLEYLTAGSTDLVSVSNNNDDNDDSVADDDEISFKPAAGSAVEGGQRPRSVEPGEGGERLLCGKEEEDEKKKTGPAGRQLDCSVCKTVCRRAVRLSCCRVQACRGCATKEVTKTRTCWFCFKRGLVTKDIVNDDELRQAIDELAAGGKQRSRMSKQKATAQLPSAGGSAKEDEERPETEEEASEKPSAVGPMKRALSTSEENASPARRTLNPALSAVSHPALASLAAAADVRRSPRHPPISKAKARRVKKSASAAVLVNTRRASGAVQQQDVEDTMQDDGQAKVAAAEAAANPEPMQQQAGLTDVESKKHVLVEVGQLNKQQDPPGKKPEAMYRSKSTASLGGGTTGDIGVNRSKRFTVVKGKREQQPRSVSHGCLLLDTRRQADGNEEGQCDGSEPCDRGPSASTDLSKVPEPDDGGGGGGVGTPDDQERGKGERGTRGLTPLSSRTRKTLLKMSGVPLDKTEMAEVNS